MKKNYRKSLSSVSFASSLALVAMLSIAGCKKKVASAPPPPPPAAVAPLPTAEIAATPSAINAGDRAVLTWRTTDATDISIEGIGPVPSSGTRTVAPGESTNYHLIAHGDGGTADATTRITVSVAPPPVADNTDNMDDATFHQYVQDVLFDYDSYDINAQSQPIISKDASYLAAHPRIKVVVGGYCDERGSTEYNIALGQNRANAAKAALTAAGVAPDRLRTVSYGKEKQFCSDHNETCWQQNRRAQLSPDR